MVRTGGPGGAPEEDEGGFQGHSCLARPRSHSPLQLLDGPAPPAANNAAAYVPPPGQHIDAAAAGSVLAQLPACIREALQVVGITHITERLESRKMFFSVSFGVRDGRRGAGPGGPRVCVFVRAARQACSAARASKYP